MRPDTPAARSLRWGVIAAGLLLPILSLIPLGSLWLFQSGWLVYWALLACATTLAAWAGQRWLLRPAAPGRETIDHASAGQAGPLGDPGWTPAEAAAWAEVQAIARAAEPEALSSQDAALELARRIVEAVARSLHPGKSQSVYEFTVPEALALAERVSARMRAFVRDNVPLGDRLTVAQMLELWRHRWLVGTAETTYDVWRAVRVINPATAVASEIRERLQKELLDWGKQHVAQRLVTAYAEEVGRAAIDLYGGRLRVAPEVISRRVTAGSARDLEAAEGEVAATHAEPLRILVAGQVGAGKSSLVNALANEVKAAVDALPTTSAFTPYRLEREGQPAALIIDSPGIATDPAQIEALADEVVAADMVLWVAAANRADRGADAAALGELRARIAARPNRRAPPMLLLLSHVDRLRPFREWSPPYDLNAGASPKAVSIKAAIEAAAADLGFPPEEVVPVCLDPAAGVYNVDAAWAGMTEALPDAQQARLVRLLRDAEGDFDWRRVWRQVRDGGRLLVRALR